jgi:hypothetical protein
MITRKTAGHVLLRAPQILPAEQLTDYGKTVIWIDLPWDFSTRSGKGMANVLITSGVGLRDAVSWRRICVFEGRSGRRAG